MQRELEIDGRPVAFKATAAIPRLYRMKFGRDIMQDMAAIQKDIEKSRGGTDLNIASLEMFENIAYIMAKHAAPVEVSDDIEAWLDGFDTFSIYQVFPEIASLWAANMGTMVDSKKK